MRSHVRSEELDNQRQPANAPDSMVGDVTYAPQHDDKDLPIARCGYFVEVFPALLAEVFVWA